MRTSDIPNLITVGRILLVAPVAWALMVKNFTLALVLFFVAGASDAVDGFLAKRFGWSSRLGALLDPMADKFLLLTCYAVLTWIDLLPVWLLLLVLTRDLLIVGGAVVYNFRIQRLEANPTLISKLNTLLQILLVLLVIVQQAIGWEQERWIDWLIYAVTVSVIWSGLDYAITWTRRARSYQ